MSLELSEPLDFSTTLIMRIGSVSIQTSDSMKFNTALLANGHQFQPLLMECSNRLTFTTTLS